MGPGPQASHQEGVSHEKKISFMFKLCGGGKKSEEETREKKIMERWR
jgi:hypothetical protein